MKKRLFSLCLAVVLLVSVVSFAIPAAHAESAMKTSEECIRILKAEEGFDKYPYWDYSQWTVGYGSTCPSDKLSYYSTNGITEAEAEELLANHLTEYEAKINDFIDRKGITVTQNQFDALLLFTYNCGYSWCYESSGIFHNAIANGATGNDLIYAFSRWCSAGGYVKTFLLRRRLISRMSFLFMYILLVLHGKMRIQ